MDITIHPASERPHRLATSLYDKRTQALCYLPTIRFKGNFSYTTSYISYQAKYGIVVRQFHRFASILMRRSNFVASMADVMLALSWMGYDVQHVATLVRRQRRSHENIYIYIWQPTSPPVCCI